MYASLIATVFLRVVDTSRSDQQMRAFDFFAHDFSAEVSISLNTKLLSTLLTSASMRLRFEAHPGSYELAPRQCALIK